MKDSNSVPVAGQWCEESEGIREMVLEAADQMVAAALSFQRDVAMSKGDAASASAAEMRVAMIKCAAANNIWGQHRAEHGC